MGNKMYDSWQFGTDPRWVSGVEWSGVECQSVSVSQSVSQGGHQTYDHNLYIGIIILPPPLKPIKLKQGSSTPHKILKTNLHQGWIYTITERSHTRFNILMPWVSTKQIQLQCASNGMTPSDTNISVLCGVNWIVDELMWLIKSLRK